MFEIKKPTGLRISFASLSWNWMFVILFYNLKYKMLYKNIFHSFFDRLVSLFFYFHFQQMSKVKYIESTLIYVFIHDKSFYSFFIFIFFWYLLKFEKSMKNHYAKCGCKWYLSISVKLQFLRKVIVVWDVQMLLVNFICIKI